MLINDNIIQEILDLLKSLSEFLKKKSNLNGQKKWLTSAEAANLLGISVRTIYFYVSKGILTSHKVGGILLFDRDEIDKLLTNNASE
jgi:excisionase family DNA binding protein